MKVIPAVMKERRVGFFPNIHHLLQGSIKYRLLFFLILFALVPLTILGAVSYSISKRTIDNKVRDYSERLIIQTAENVDFRLSAYKDTMIQIITNPEIIRILKEINTTAPVEQNRQESITLTTKLAYYIATSPEFKSVSFISKKHYIKGIFWWNDTGDVKSRFYRTTMRGENNFGWFPTRAGHFADSVDNHTENVFSLTKQIFDINDGSSLGTVAVLDIREEILAEICNKSSTGLPIQSFIIDENGMIIAYPQEKLLFKNIKNILEPKTLFNAKAFQRKQTSFWSRYMGKRVLVNTVKLETNNWRVINIIDRSYLYRESNGVIKAILVIGFLCVFFAVLAAYFIARGITRPLQQIVSAMKQVVAGNLSVRIKKESFSTNPTNEFNILQNTFDFMVSKIEELIDEVYEEQNSKRIAEIKALEMQFNPHFLYNTLDTIKWAALIQKANNAAEMANLLSRLLHISLGKGEETITVLEEIEHVQCYLGIQKLRFNFNIEINIIIAEDTKTLKTPKLILQPIVENAILHGLADKSEGATLTIRTALVDGKLKFEVEDNGLGFDPQELNAIKESKRKSGEIFSGIGISNVNERIQLICGPQYGIKISSQPQIGTKVEIWIPILTQEVEKC
jgi:two-component system sensor histidine kinase YesM